MVAPGGGGGDDTQVYKSVFVVDDQASGPIAKINAGWREHLAVLRATALAENDNAEGMAKVNAVHQSAVASYNAAARAALNLTATENQYTRAIENELVALEALNVQKKLNPVLSDRAAEALRAEQAMQRSITNHQPAKGQSDEDSQIALDRKKERLQELINLRELADATASKGLEDLSSKEVRLAELKDATARADLARGQAQDTVNKALAQGAVHEVNLAKLGQAKVAVNNDLANATRLVEASEKAHTQSIANTARASDDLASSRRRVAAAEQEVASAITIGATRGGTPQKEAQNVYDEARARELLARAKEVEAGKAVALAAAQQAEAVSAHRLAEAKAEQAVANMALSPAEVIAAVDATKTTAANVAVADTALIAAKNLQGEAIAATDAAVGLRLAAKDAVAFAAANTVAGKSALTTDQRMLGMGASMAIGQRGLGGMALALGDMAGAGLPAIAVIAGVGLAIAAAAKESVEWEKILVTMQNNIAVTDQTLKQMDQTIRSVGQATGATFEDMAEGERRILDYAFAASEAGEILARTSEAAVSTGAKTADVAQAIAQALHQYGESAYSAAEYTNVLLINAQRANFSMEEFSQATKRATGIAAELSVPYEQVVSALSALTRVYGSASEAQTQVVNIMRYLIHPGQEQAEAWDALAEKTGRLELASENLATTLSEGGLTGILSSLRGAYNQLGLSTEQAAQQTLTLMNSQRGGFGLLTLLTGASEDYAGNLQASARVLSGELNPAQEAFGRTQDTAANQLDRLGNDIKSAAIDFGDVLLPALKEVIKSMADLAEATGKTLSALKFLGPVIEGIARAAGSYLNPLGPFTEQAEEARKAVEKLAAAEAARLQAQGGGGDRDFGFTGDAGAAATLAEDKYSALGEGADKLSEQQRALVVAYVEGNKEIADSSDSLTQTEEANATRRYNSLDVYARKVRDNAAQIISAQQGYDQEYATLLASESQRQFQGLDSAEQVAARQKVLLDAGVTNEKMTTQEKLAALDAYVKEYAQGALDVNTATMDTTQKTSQAAFMASQNLGAAMEMVRQYREELNKGVPEDVGTRPERGNKPGKIETDLGVETAQEQADRLKKIFDDVEKSAEKKGFGILQALEQERVQTRQKLDDINAAQQAAAQIGGGFGAAMAANYDVMAKSMELSLSDIDKAIASLAHTDLVSSIGDQAKQLSEILATDGVDGAREYAQGLLDQMSALPPDVQAALTPMMDFLRDIALDMGTIGAEGGDAYGANTVDGIFAHLDPIRQTLFQYQSAADMRDLFSTLGIETGDNYGQKIRDRVEAWFEPFKAQLELYLRAVQVTARAAEERIKSTVNMVKNVASAMAGVPGVGDWLGDQASSLAAAGAAAAGAIREEAIDSTQSAIAELNGLKSTVDAQADAAIAKHDADAAAKANKAAQSAAEKAAREREQALAAMQAVADNRALAAANEAVAAATEKAAKQTALYKTILDGLDAKLKTAQNELKNMADASEEKIHSLNVELHYAQLNLDQMEKEGAAALKPLQNDVDAANKKLQELQSTAAKVREVWQDQKDAVSDLMYEFEAGAKAAMAPFNAEMQRLNDELYTLGQLREATLRPLNDQLYELGEASKFALRAFDDALYDQNKIMKDLQDSAEATAEVYDAKLIPLQKELAALKLLDEKDNRAKELNDMAQTVGNLDARVRNAIPGSKQYNELVKLRGEAMDKLNRKQKEYSLEDQIKAIEAAKTASAEAADAQIKAQQKILDGLAQQREEVRRSYELQQRVLQDQVDAQTRAFDLAQRGLQDQLDLQTRGAELTARQQQQEREMLQEKMALLNRQQELYERMERDEETKATDAVKAAQDRYDAEKKFQDDRSQATRDWILLLQEEVAKEQWREGEAERIKNKEIGGIQETINMVKENQRVDDEASKAEIKGHQDALKALQDSIDERKDSAATAEALATYAEKFGTNMDTAKRVLDEMTPKWERFAPATKAAADALKNDLGPQVVGMATNVQKPLNDTADEWGKIFGIGGDTGSGVGKLATMLFSKDQSKGYFSWQDNKLKLAMGDDGFKGVMMNSLTVFFEAVDTRFTEEKPSTDLALKNFGIYLSDGIAVGLADEIANARLSDAIAAAVNKAIDDAEKKVGINSPSTLTRDRLGRPLGAGIPVGIMMEAAAMGRAFDTSINGAVSLSAGRRRSMSAVPMYSTGVATMGGARGDIHIHLDGLQVVLPGVRRMDDLSKNPSDWDQLARPIAIAVNKYEETVGITNPWRKGSNK